MRAKPFPMDLCHTGAVIKERCEMAATANRLTVPNLMPLPTPVELERRKVDRLRELQAVIESLRCEQESRDPLLAWAIQAENSPNP
jgi:hypothetical protein